MECSRSLVPSRADDRLLKKEWLTAVELNDFRVAFHPNFYARLVRVNLKSKILLCLP